MAEVNTCPEDSDEAEKEGRMFQSREQVIQVGLGEQSGEITGASLWHAALNVRLSSETEC